MIRQATIMDTSLLIEMLNTMHRETEIEVPKINTDKLIKQINNLIINGLVLVAFKDNKLQGSIGGILTEDWWSTEKYLADAWFYVHKKQRNTKVAINLLKTYIEMAKKSDYKIRLGHIFSGDLDRKDNFFKKLGFVKAGSVFVEV